MILPARLLYGVLSFPRKFCKRITSILMYILIKFGIKNVCFYIEKYML